MKSFLLWTCLIACLTTALGQQPARIQIDTEGDVHPWNNLDLNNDPQTFQFAIVTDRTGGHRPGVFPVGVEKLNLLQPEFVMSVGDLIEGYTEDEARIDREWDEFVGFIDDLTVPFFYVPGNHDFINDVMEKKWRERFGKDYYHFVYQDVLFLCLNTEELKRGASRGYIAQPQYKYIKETLAANQEVKWTLIFMHQPLWDQPDNGMWPEVEKLLKDRKHTVFAGHRHRYVKYLRNQSNYFILATTGGGSGLRGPAFGEFDHVVWITMTDDGPIMANLLLDGIWDENVRTEEMLERQQALFRQKLLEIEPIINDGSLFESGKWVLKFTNPADIPLVVESTVASNDQLWVSKGEATDTVPPNDVKRIEIPVRNPRNLTHRKLEPVKLDVTYRFQEEGRPELTWQESVNLKPITFNSFSKQPEKITIDGSIEEWGTLSQKVEKPYVDANPFSHEGSEDLFFSFEVTQDDKYVYLAAKVMDDEIYFTGEDDPFKQDAVAFFIDGRPMATLTSGDAGRPFVDFPIVGIAPNQKGKAQTFRESQLPPGTKVASQQFEGGYSVEAALPIKYLESLQGKEWQYLRLNVAVRDIDLDGGHRTTLYWTPYWLDETDEAGSGIFKR